MTTQSTPNEPFRDFALAPQPGESVDLYKVIACTPDRLLLKVRSGCMLVGVAVALIVAVISFAVYASMPKTGNNYDIHYGGKFITAGIISLALGAGMLAAVGRSFDVDKIKRRVIATSFFIRSREFNIADFDSVELFVKKPTEATETGTNKTTVTSAPPRAHANQVELYMVGTDSNRQPIKLLVGRALLWTTKDWPVIAATAIHVCKMLNKPLIIDGAIDRLNDKATAQVAQIKTLGGSVIA